MRAVKNMPLLEDGEKRIGKRVAAAALLQEILKDRLFFEQSGGGVTFSGGEPLLQYEFLSALLQMCKKEGVHTVVDTTGYTSYEHLAGIRPHVDLFLYDVKLLDDALHKKYTGVSNRLILNNLKQLDRDGAPVLVRIPLIPAITDTAQNLHAVARFLKENTSVRRVELLPYNSMGESKYERLNMENRIGHLQMQEQKEVQIMKMIFIRAGIEVVE